MAGSLSHRLAKIEQGMGQIGSRCIHCEQYYWRLVSTNSRPRNPNCPRGCNKWGPWLDNIKAGVLLNYPKVAEVFIECLREYAAKPLEDRCHYMMCPDIREEGKDEYGSAREGGGGK